MKVKWTGPARRDLLELHEILRLRDPGAARRYVAAVREASDRLGEFPEVGARFDPRPIGGEFRSVVVRNHRLIYRLDRELIIVFRLWDCRQEPDALWPLLEHE
ncbi:MAG: type II toxin-antitoxin system RelE/ParE family toxin [Deltaproteobacteria bacterium]|nr:type II toxin-antitoxin system RelE/ParE family toxin [Deltaproteobacteria bacterium]